MNKARFHHPDGTVDDVDIADSETLMKAAVSHSVSGIIGECGGRAMCATCHVHVWAEHATVLPEMSEEEDDMLDAVLEQRIEGRSRLGCQLTAGIDFTELDVDVPGQTFS
jgi:2Fe-2S ferredoxin